MVRKTVLNKDHFTFKLYQRSLPSGNIYYARFLKKNCNIILADRSTGESDEKLANIAAGKLLALLPLDKKYRKKTSEFSEKIEGAERIKNMPFADFLTWFWDINTSEYIQDRVDAGKSLSSKYIKDQVRNIKKYATTYAPFKRTQLREITLYFLEQWMRHLKRTVNNNNIIVDALAALKTPFSWAKKRTMIDEPFEISAIVKPKQTYRKRGILSRSEVAQIVELSVVDKIIPRPRLKGGKKNEGIPPADIRMKAVVLLSELAAMRRGEIRALRWKNVDFENKTISVVENFVELDGLKEPKKDSTGTIPMADDLVTVLNELKRVASTKGFDNADDYVVFNKKRGVPIATITIKRGFRRILALIGIEDDSEAFIEKRPPHSGSQQARHLVLHSGRHGAATRLAEAIGARNAAKVTRHKSPQAFMGYADHDTEETFEKARKALNVVDTMGKNDNCLNYKNTV